MILTCMAMGFALVIGERLQQGLPLLKQINKAEPAPPAIKALLDNTCERAGINPSKVKLSILTETFNAESKTEKALPYGAFIMPSQNHYFLGQKAIEMLDLDETQNLLAHETGHLINRPTLGRGDTITEKTITSGLFLMGLASLATLNFLSAGYIWLRLMRPRLGVHNWCGLMNIAPIVALPYYPTSPKKARKP